MSRFHGLTATNPERKKVAADVEQGCDSLAWQVCN
jgi:syntaxin 6